MGHLLTRRAAALELSQGLRIVLFVPRVATRRCRTYRYRLHPTVRQTQALSRQLELQRELYNAALEERIGAWKWERRSVSYVDQCRTLTGLKAVRPEVLSSGVTLCRGTLKRLDRAFSGFYRRVQHGEPPGFPSVSLGPALGLFAVGGPLGLETHRREKTQTPGHRRNQDELPPSAPGNPQSHHGEARGHEVVGQCALRGCASYALAPDRS